VVTDTPNPRLKADTAPNTPLKIPPIRPPAAVRPVVRGKSDQPLRIRGPLSYWFLGGTGVVVTTLVIVLLVWLLSSGGKHSTDRTETGTAFQDVYVDNADPAEAVRQLAFRVRQASQHQRIIVKSPVLEGTLDVAGAKDITIEPEEGKRVNWRLGPIHDKRMIYFHDVEDIVFRGFELDGQDGVDHVIELAMHCPGLKLLDLELRGFQRYGIVAANCSGTQDDPILLSGIKFLPAWERDAGLIFQINLAITDPAVNDYIRVSDCVWGNLKATSVLAKPSAIGQHIISP